MRTKVLVRVAAMLALASSFACIAQPAEVGIAPVALSSEPYVFDTAEQHKIRVTVVAQGLKHPWSLAFLPSGDALITERGVRLRFLQNAVGAAGVPTVLESDPVAGVPPLDRAHPRLGIHEVTLHPQFATNNWVYFTFNKPSEEKSPAKFAALGQARFALMRGKLSGRKLVDVEELFLGEISSTSGSRIAFGPAGRVYVATGSPFSEVKPQHLDSAYGKVLRLTENGKAPGDNPFVGRTHVLPEIYSYGHSAHYGLAFHPATGALLNAENGLNGGDEVNLILPGRNYGWPHVGFGRHHSGERVSESPVAVGIEQPILVWLPSVTPSGMTFYTGERFPQWKDNLFVGAIRRGGLPRTGGLERIVLNEKLEELRRESLLGDLHQRVRDVRQGPDGLLYVLTDEDNGALLRIEPST